MHGTRAHTRAHTSIVVVRLLYRDKEGQAAFEYLLLCGGRMSEEVKK